MKKGIEIPSGERAEQLGAIRAVESGESLSSEIGRGLAEGPAVPVGVVAAIESSICAFAFSDATLPSSTRTPLLDLCSQQAYPPVCILLNSLNRLRGPTSLRIR
jgi:hypothetical protein